MIALLRRLDRGLYRICLGLGIAALVGVVAVAFAQVVSRYVMRHPLVWSEELATYLFIWLSMLGAAAAVHAKGHYGFDLLLTRIPPAARRAVEALTLLLCIGVAAAIAWLGGEMALGAGNTSASLGLGMAWFYVALPFGACAMCVHFGVRLAELGAGFRHDKTGHDKTGRDETGRDETGRDKTGRDENPVALS